MSDEPKPIHWLPLSLVAWLIHLILIGGVLVRVLSVGPGYERTYAEYNLKLPMATEQLLKLTTPQGPLPFGILALLAVLDLVILVGLARWERPLFKWWFFGVLLLLLFAWPVVEYVMYLPEIKLREALSK